MRGDTSAAARHDLEARPGGLHSATIESAATQAALQPWVEMECYQLSRGKQLSQMDTLDLGPMQIVRERQLAAIHKLGATPADLCTLSYCTPHAARPDADDGAFRFTEHGAAGQYSVFFMPERTAFDIHVPPDTETVYLSFSQSEFVAAATALNPDAWRVAPKGIVQFQSRHRGVLMGAVEHWLKAAKTAQSHGETMTPAVLQGIVLQAALRIALPDDIATPLPSRARSRALRLGRLARDYVEAQFDAHALPTIVDICKTLAVSERALLYAFHDYVGLSPQAYLRRCRLNRVRTALLAARPQETTVTRVAMQFGFLHLGRFAGEYRQIFDELPGATLARAV